MTAASAARPGRNEPCHCASGRKYKQCCLDRDEAAAREAREKAAAEAPLVAADPVSATHAPAQRTRTHQPWKKTATNTHGFGRMSTPRKIGAS